MWELARAAGFMVLGVLSIPVAGHHAKGPLRVLRMDSREIRLPFRVERAGIPAIERSALAATGGGQVESIRPSVWIGKPVWMCTVAQGRNMWHVMISQHTLRPVSKIVVPGR